MYVTQNGLHRAIKNLVTREKYQYDHDSACHSESRAVSYSPTW